MDNKILALSISVAIAILVGVIFVDIVASSVADRTILLSATAEAHAGAFNLTSVAVNTEAVDATGFTNGTGYTLAGKAVANSQTFAIVALYNNTNSLLTAGNYTINTTTGVLKNATALAGLVNVKVNYTYIKPLIATTTVFTVTNPPTGWETADCPLTNFAVKNATGSALTPTTDYSYDLSAGTYSLKDTVNTNTTLGLYPSNNTYATYSYCGEDYVSGWAGTVLNMTPGFFAIALILIGGLVLFYVVGKKN